MAYDFSSFKKGIKEVDEWLKKEYSGIRTGRATPAVLDGIKIESYGAQMPISQVANISSEGAKSLRITPWDMSQVKAIEKAILISGLGLSASSDDKGVRVIFPELTTETRNSLIKIVKQKLEDARVSLRAEREKAWEGIQAKEKEGGMGEDEKFRLKNEMQKIIDEANKSLDETAVRKEKEIMS